MHETVINALSQALANNQGNRLTPELISGIVYSLVQYMQSLDAQNQNAQRADG